MNDVLVIGGGPAGVSAAVYAARAGLTVTLVYKDGGALAKAERVDNYYGLYSTSGTDMFDKGIAQAQAVGVTMVQGEVVKLSQDEAGAVFAADITGTAQVQARAVVLATGSARAVPPIEGLAAFERKGVSYCAVCDGFFFRGKDVAVLGNGAYALSEAQELLPLAGSVTVLTNGAEPIVDFPDPIKIVTDKIQAVTGEKTVAGVTLESGETIAAAGVFVAVGTAGGSQLAMKLGAFINDESVVTDDHGRTSIAGLWAAGDCTAGVKQIARAVQEGMAAGMDVVQFARKERQK